MKKVLYLLFIVTLIGVTAWVTELLAQKRMTEPPIGTPRTADEFSKDADYLIEARRSAVSDGESAILFKPGRCLKCHENKPGVEGQIFYNYPDFRKDVAWPDYIAHPERLHAPSLDYDFFDTHAGRKKRLPMTIGQDIEQRMKQMQETPLPLIPSQRPIALASGRNGYPGGERRRDGIFPSKGRGDEDAY